MVRRKEPVVTRELDAWRRHQRGQPGHEVTIFDQWLYFALGVGSLMFLLAGPPHNALISMTLMYGVFGTLIYASIFVRIIRSLNALRRLKIDAPLPPSAYGTYMLTLTVIYVSVAMFTDVMAFNFLGNLYFMLAGGADGLRIYLSSRAPALAASPASVPRLAPPASGAA